MSEDFDGEYGDVVVAVTAAGLPDVVAYLNRHAQIMSKLRRENELLHNENKRLHADNEEKSVYLREQRERLKPDGPLMNKQTVLLALEVLVDADIISNDPWDDWHADYIRRQIDKM